MIRMLNDLHGSHWAWFICLAYWKHLESSPRLWFRPMEAPDLTSKEMSSSYQKFTLPSKEEGPFVVVAACWAWWDSSRSIMEKRGWWLHAVWHVRGGPLDFEHLAKTINPCIVDVYREDTVAIFGIAEGIQKIEHVCWMISMIIVLYLYRSSQVNSIIDHRAISTVWIYLHSFFSWTVFVRLWRAQLFVVQRSSKQGVLEEMGALDADAPVEEGKDFSQKIAVDISCFSFFMTDFVRCSSFFSYAFFKNKLQPMATSSTDDMHIDVRRCWSEKWPSELKTCSTLEYVSSSTRWYTIPKSKHGTWKHARFSTWVPSFFQR